QSKAYWPQWRGPTGMGHCDEKDLPLAWDARNGSNVLWKAPLRGGEANSAISSPGHSCPIVWGDRVFITTACWPANLTQEEGGRVTAGPPALGVGPGAGKLLGATPGPAGKSRVTSPFHGYAVPTPVTDGERVFAVFGSEVVAALDAGGKIVWREELPRKGDVS